MPDPKSEQKSLAEILKDIQALESIVENWDEQQKRTVNALKLAIDELNREAFSRLIRSAKTDPSAMQALKQALGDEVVYAVLRHHQLVKPSLQERVERALDSVRPALREHGGNVDLVSVEPPDTVLVRLVGACSSCPSSELTLAEGVEKAIKEYCPEIREIKRTKSSGTCTDSSVNFVSPFARGSIEKWTYAIDLTLMKEGELTVAEVNGQSLLLLRKGNEVVCYQNSCAHLGLPLDMGVFENGILTCPHHGFQFAIDSGECLTVPQVQLQTYAVRVRENLVEVQI